jgi:filamentous hemagglutinin family protein
MNKTSSAIVRTILLGTSCLSVLGLSAAQADPAGGVVVSGSATITGKPNATIINQATDRALINWQSFNIAAGGSVRFNQPGSKSITVNRVLGSQSSSIFGSLLANGQVWIINGNGILFGKGAQVNVGGLIATTADITDRDFENGNFSFSGGTGASVVNQGTIRTRNGGSAVLSGASVQNQGLIAADTGTVVLGGASAFTVDFNGDNLLRYAITAPAGKADNGQTGVSNSGSISAAGGHVILTARAAADIAGAVINNTGMISATSARVANGEVVLDGGDGDVNVSGSIDASGRASGQTGGSVAITGRNITVADNTTINVSGDSGGGTVRIGGDLHGAGALQNADNVTVGSATIRADAIRRGKGGTLVVWSNGLTDFSGIFSAKGGLMGGDGGFIETSGHTLNVGSGASVDTRAPHGKTGTWLLDPDTIVIQAGEGTGTPIPPGGTLSVDTDSEDTDIVRPSTIIAALATTNVTLEASREIDVYSPVIYSSSNALNLLSEGNISVYASIQNTQAVGGGAVNLVAGWDGVTAMGDILTTPGAYGSGFNEVFLDSSDNDVFVGSASGATTIAAADITLFAEDGGNVQLGYHGAGGGNIAVYATDNISLTAQAPGEGAHYAMIGNGALDGSVAGAITGDIFVSSLGSIFLATEEGGPGCDCANIGQESAGGDLVGIGRTIGIGNESGIGEVPATGNVVIIAADVDDDLDASAGLSDIISAQLAHGDMTLGHIGEESSINVDDFVDYDSPFALTLLSTSDIEITGHLMNAGSGAVTLIAGWDGVYDAAHLTDTGHYGLNGGSITIGGEDAETDASIGSAHGALHLYGANLNIDPENGFAQVGYHGAGGGDIFVNMTGDISAFGNADVAKYYALLGNGSLDAGIEGNITGNISLVAGGQTVFADRMGRGWLGNVADEGFIETGDLTALTRTGFFRADYLSADLGTVAGTGGNVFIGFTDAEVGDLFIGGFTYTSANDFTFAGAAGMNVTGTVSNAGSGAVTLVAGWDGHTVGTAAQIQGAGAYGLNGAVTTIGGENQNQDVSLGSASGRTTILTGDLTVAPKAGFYAQVGYHGTGGGDIFVVARGDLTLTAGGVPHDYAMIGNGSLNGDVTGNITGNIDLRIAGSTFLDGSAGEGVKAWIGNVAGGGFSETGNLLLETFDLDGSDAISPMLASDVSGGDVTIAITDSEAQNVLDNAIVYNSTHNLTLLTAGSVTFLSSVQNGGSGAVTILAGWNGITFDPAHFTDAGVFGNNNGSVLIGGADAEGSVAVGSASGHTNVFAKNVVLSGLHGYAQLGYHGAAGGVIAVNALGVVSLIGGANAGDYATIGNGTVFGSNAAGGDVGVSSGSITDYGNAAITGANLKLAAASGGIGNAGPGGALRIAAGTLAVMTHGGAVYLTSPGGGVAFGLGGVQTMGGSFTLAAAGPITQSAALQTGALNLSTTSGAITLTDAGNSFGALTVATSGSDNATFSQASSLTIASAAVGGTLSLTGSAITQTGAIHAGGLSVTATGGPITLTSSGNSFATLTVNDTSANDVSIVDGSAVTLAGATVNGKLTLAAGGAIGQSGAIHAGALDVSTITGAITLTNTGNAFGALTVTTHGSDNASFAHSSLLTVASANVGGTLTLAAGTAVNQSGAIHAAALNVSAANGSIVLSNSGNAFGALTASTTGSNDATIIDSMGVSVSGATIGGKLTLVSGGAISQTGAIVAAALDVSSTGGAIALTNGGNSFATLTVATNGSNDASVTDSTAVTLAGVTVGGNFGLAAGGAVGQTGAITTHGLSVSASSGAITLTKATNAVSGTAQFTTPGAASFANSLATIVGASTVGGDVTLLSKGNVNFVGSVQSVSGNILVVAGWDGTTTDPSAFGNAGVYGNGGGDVVIGGSGAAGAVAVGSQHGSTSLYASSVTLSGDHGLAQLGYHGTGGGAIKLVALHNLQANASSFGALVGNGSLSGDVTGNVTGDIDIHLGGSGGFSGAQAWLGNVAHAGTETGNLVFVAANAIGTFGSYVTSALVGGDVTIGFTGTTDQGLAGTIAYNSSHTFNLLNAGNIVVVGTLQNAGSGAINLVAGWDGHTLTASSFGTAGVYGNNGKGLTIGGSGAAGNASVGSFGGKTSVYGASLTLAAVHGYAQLGFNGHGTGAILVQTTGAVTLTGGGGANQFAQIGNGGRGTSGSNSGDIQITAGGDLTLTAGAGAEAYAQIGHGGAESNTGVSGGYSNTGAISVTAANVFLNAGGGAGAYSQIGNGGYKSGLNIAGGTANNGGDITITSGHAVTLTGNGADAYAQIGNGGSQSNQNAAAAAGGSDSGNIVVHAPNGAAGSVTLTAGAGASAYAQIGNGGYAVNSGPNATVASWTITGDVSVTDLVLTGGNTGPNAYAQIGNGDASHNSTGNVSGNITIDANGQITYSDGTAPHSPATIGNFTGQGTVTGTLTGAQPPSDVTTDPAVIGNIAVNTADNGSPTTNVPVITTVVITDTEEGGRPTVTAVALETSPPGPLALLDKSGADSSSPNTSDTATIVIADSLDGSKKGSGSQFFMGGMLKQTIPGSAVHGVPPADQDFSSWGNEALWQ